MAKDPPQSDIVSQSPDKNAGGNTNQVDQTTQGAQLHSRFKISLVDTTGIKSRIL